MSVIPARRWSAGRGWGHGSSRGQRAGDRAATAGACVRVPPEFVAEANELIAACSGGEIARRALGCRRQITSAAPLNDPRGQREHRAHRGRDGGIR